MSDCLKQICLDNVDKIQEAINGLFKTRPDLADWFHIPEDLKRSITTAQVDLIGTEEALCIDGAYLLWHEGKIKRATPSRYSVAIPIPDGELRMGVV